MKILVVDDEKSARESLCDIIRALQPDSEILIASGGVEAIEVIHRVPDINLAILDIEMGDINGLSVAMAINKISPKINIVFATAYGTHALKAFEIGAVDYILKPFDEERIKETLRRTNQASYNYTFANREIDKITISSGKVIKIISPRDIAYIETSGRGCIVHTKGRDIIEDKSTISTYERRLIGYSFFRIHKSYLANIEFLEEITTLHGAYVMYIKGQEIPLPIGRAALKILRQMYHF